MFIEQIKKIGINNKRDYVETNRMFYEEYELDIVQYTKKHFPQWVGIFDETDVEKDKRKMDEFMKSIE